MSIQAALEREHRDIDDCLSDYLSDPSLTDVLLTGLHALKRHIYLEEEFLFPPLRDAGLTMPVQVMIREHGELWRLTDALESQMGDPEAAAATASKLAALLDLHNSKEEPMLYPHAGTALTSQAAEQLEIFLGMGSLPHGWVCATA